MIVPELINIIVNYLYYIEDIMKIYNLSKYTQKNIKITNLYDIDKSKLKYIRQNTIEQDMFKYLEKLDCKDNIYIESLNHLVNLRTLDCSSLDLECKISQKSIANLRLTDLYMLYNDEILNLNNMKDSLKYLNCSSTCLDQEGISELNLEELVACDCSNITSLNHMKTLKILDCSSSCPASPFCCEGCTISQSSISNLELVKINYRYNTNIIDVKHMKHCIKEVIVEKERGKYFI